MSTAVPVSLSLPYKVARATDSADTSFPSRVPTVTEPSGDGVVDIQGSGVASTWLMLVPFGTDANNETFDVRVVGWRNVGTLWIPTILLQFSATLGNVVGVAGTDVLATHFLADTVSDPVAGMGSVGVNCQPSSPANDTPAHYLFDTRGCPKVEILFDLTGAAAANCLVAKV